MNKATISLHKHLPREGNYAELLNYQKRGYYWQPSSVRM